MSKTITAQEMVRLVRQSISTTQIARAKELGVKKTYLNKVLLGQKPVSKKLAARFGYKPVRVTTIKYVPLTDD